MGNNQVAILVPLSVMMVLATLNGFIRDASGAGECGRTPISSAFASLSPCLGAARDPQAKVPPACCTKVHKLIQIDPRCLCAVLLSPAAKEAQIIPAAAISIPKRCNIRSAGSKCRILSATEVEISPSPSPVQAEEADTRKREEDREDSEATARMISTWRTGG